DLGDAVVCRCVRTAPENNRVVLHVPDDGCSDVARDGPLEQRRVTLLVVVAELLLRDVVTPLDQRDQLDHRCTDPFPVLALPGRLYGHPTTPKRFGESRSARIAGRRYWCHSAWHDSAARFAPPTGGFLMALLDGKVAVITGAGSGMAKASTKIFVREGASVVATDISGAENDTAKEVGDAVM